MMKPPICSVCQKMNHGAKLVQFADYRPLAPGIVGHPHGLAWFCSEHAGTAKALADKPLDEALRLLRSQR